MLRETKRFISIDLNQGQEMDDSHFRFYGFTRLRWLAFVDRLFPIRRHANYAQRMLSAVSP
jgi:hypothetical protein